MAITPSLKASRRVLFIVVWYAFITEKLIDHILVYGDSLTWGIIPGTRQRLVFERRWPRVLERELIQLGSDVRVIEDCLNGRRTVWDDPFKSGRNGLLGLEQRIEINSPLSLLVLMLGANDFQSVHHHSAWQSSQGIATLVHAIRRAPIEPGMPTPRVLIVAPPLIRTVDGEMAPKFAGAQETCAGVADAYQLVAKELECSFFDSSRVIHASPVDGVHLDADQHQVLGRELAPVVASLLLAS
jgi:lysophospholipase L1-like esterase